MMKGDNPFATERLLGCLRLRSRHRRVQGKKLLQILEGNEELLGFIAGADKSINTA